MLHPFAGIIPADGPTEAHTGLIAASAPRRNFLQLLGGSLAGLAGWTLLRPARAEQPGRVPAPPTPPQGQGRSTTQALGEEGGGEHRGRQGEVTTFALGEEAGGNRRREGNYTTYALGEEGAGPPPPDEGRYTTYALGEEGADGGRYTTQALGEEGAGGGRYTTQALGEEGGPGHYHPPRGGRYTTQALYEEGGGSYYWEWNPRPRRWRWW